MHAKNPDVFFWCRTAQINPCVARWRVGDKKVERSPSEHQVNTRTKKWGTGTSPDKRGHWTTVSLKSLTED